MLNTALSNIASSQIIKYALEKIPQNNHIPPKGSKIIIGMSGGVDSSTTAVLLKLMGYEIIGVTAWLSETVNKTCDGGRQDAQKVAEFLDIKHFVIDLKEHFRQIIIDPFLEAYQAGLTPVPCMFCNTKIKWGALYNHIIQNEMFSGTENNNIYFATGHYMRLLKKEESNEFCNGYTLGRAEDKNKDQTYMLWTLTPEQLSKSFFPLANFSKGELRAIAQELGLFNAKKPESQDICFVGDKTSNYLQNNIGTKPGEIRHYKTDAFLGTHSGIHLFTIGQRKGLGIAHNEPLYVIKTDAIRNIVFVGEKEDLLAKKLKSSNINWQLQPKKSEFRGLVKIRYATAPAIADIIWHSDNNTMDIFFQEEQHSITPGQASVIYDLDDNYLLGGAWISPD